MQQNLTLKNAAGFDASYFAKMADLAGLKSDVDKLDIDKLKHLLNRLVSLKMKEVKLNVDKFVLVSVDLNKLSDTVKNGIVKKTEYDELVNMIRLI